MSDKQTRSTVAQACSKGIDGLTEVSDWWLEHRSEVTSKSRWEYIAQRLTGAMEDLRRAKDEAEGRTDASSRIRKRRSVA
jgi:hypothetical protein